MFSGLFFSLSQIPTAVLARSHHGVGAFLVNAFLFLNVVTPKLRLVQTVLTGPTVRADTARTLSTWPQLMFVPTLLHGPLRLQLLRGDLSKTMLFHGLLRSCLV